MFVSLWACLVAVCPVCNMIRPKSSNSSISPFKVNKDRPPFWVSIQHVTLNLLSVAPHLIVRPIQSRKRGYAADDVAVHEYLVWLCIESARPVWSVRPSGSGRHQPLVNRHRWWETSTNYIQETMSSTVRLCRMTVIWHWVSSTRFWGPIYKRS